MLVVVIGVPVVMPVFMPVVMVVTVGMAIAGVSVGRCPQSGLALQQKLVVDAHGEQGHHGKERIAQEALVDVEIETAVGNAAIEEEPQCNQQYS